MFFYYCIFPCLKCFTLNFCFLTFFVRFLHLELGLMSEERMKPPNLHKILPSQEPKKLYRGRKIAIPRTFSEFMYNLVLTSSGAYTTKTNGTYREPCQNRCTQHWIGIAFLEKVQIAIFCSCTIVCTLYTVHRC